MSNPKIVTETVVLSVVLEVDNLLKEDLTETLIPDLVGSIQDRFRYSLGKTKVVSAKIAESEILP